MRKGNKNRVVALLLALACVCSLAACQEVQEEQYDTAAKPVIYLYPEEETQVTVQLDYAGELTCTYPAYQDGWTVTASPDGTLTDNQGQTYNYLYWRARTTWSTTSPRASAWPGRTRQPSWKTP